VSLTDLNDEWRILRRLPSDLATQEGLIDLALSADKTAMFPTFSLAAKKLLLLPIGTATVERSFSTMKRILSSERCRLNAEHSCQLMQMSIEGTCVPDIREATPGDCLAMNKIIDAAYSIWLETRRRGLQ
jgi:hypothetical protein